MGKAKTKKSAKKRFHITGTGRVTRRSTQLNHLLTKKSAAKKRRLGLPTEVTGGQLRQVRVLMPNDF